MASPRTFDDRLRQYATPTQIKYLDAVKLHGSFMAAARALGVNKNAVQASLDGLERRGTIQGLSAAHDMLHTAPLPFKVKGTSTLYDADGTPKLQWVKTKLDEDLAEEAIRAFIAGLVEDARGLSPIVPEPAHALSDLMAIYPMGDPHFGMKAWVEETGASFDLDIAERLLFAAVDRLVETSPPAALALILNLGDFFHADNQDNRTGSGHQLDVDTRWQKVMQVGLRVMIRVIIRALEKHETVMVRNVKGNHDNHSSFALSLALDAYFSNNPRVQVQLSPRGFWYHRFGKVLIGATHGDTCKLADLPGIMAADEPQAWGLTAHRYFYFGHVHHDQVKEFPGMKAESFRTLAAADAWHAAAGYRSGRDMRSIIMHSEHGEVERHRCDVAMLT
jgi:hypothetical protein